MEHAASSPRTWPWIVLAIVLTALTFWARCTTYRSVFPPSGEVELVPTDSHFYVRFALLQRHAFPALTTHDPFINHPEGAQLYVPIPHGLIIAAFIGVFGEAQAERAAAWVGPVVGTLEWLLVAALAVRLLGRRRGAAVAGLLALTPAIVEVAAIGNADHHVHEPMFAAAVLLLTLGVARAPERLAGAAVAGGVLGLARWLTPTGFLFIPLAALGLALTSLRTRDPRLAVAAMVQGLFAAVVLLLGAVAFGRPGAVDYEQFSLFHPLLALASFGGSAAVSFALSRSWPRAAISAAVSVGAAVPLIAQVIRASGHLGRADPLLAIVYESEPLWSDWSWALELLGPFLVVAIPALVGLALGLRERDEVSSVGVTLAFAGPLALAGMMQARFSPLLAASIAFACVLGLPRLVPREGAARAAVIAVLAVLALPLGISMLPRPFRPAPRDLLLARPTLRWMRDHLPPASSDPFSSTEKPAYGVVTTHLLGHVVPLWAQRPTVATMLSQDPSFVAANARAAAVLAAEDDETAYQAALATGARYVMVTPTDRILGHGPPSERSQLRLLLDHAGMASTQRPASGHFRLIHDSDEQRLRAEGGSAARVFEIVRGASFGTRHMACHQHEASTEVRTNRGEVFLYTARSVRHPDGTDLLRVAYPGRYRLSGCGEAEVWDVSEEDIRRGMGLIRAR